MASKMKNPKTDGYVEPFPINEEEDTIAVRTIETDKGKQFIIRSKDPYALWEIKAKTGRTPEALSGLFTSQQDAQRQIDIYVNK